MCQVDGTVWDLLYRDGVWFVAGKFEYARPAGAAPGVGEVLRRGLAACDALTGAVLPWDAQLLYTAAADTEVRSLSLSPDGSVLYIGGRFTWVGGSEEIRKHAISVDADTGAYRPSWRPRPNRRLYAILASPDGETVYLGGDFFEIESSSAARTQVAAVAASNALVVPSFDPLLERNDAGTPWIHALALSGDGETLYFGGNFDEVDNQARNSVAAVDANTGALQPFAPDLEDTNPLDQEVTVADLIWHEGFIYICGDWWLTEGIGSNTDQRNINRFRPDTSLADRSWWPSTDGGVQACALDPIERVVYVGGHFDVANGISSPDLFAFDLAGNAVPEWRPGTNGTEGVYGLRLGAGALAVGGRFTSTGGSTAESAARYTIAREAAMVIGNPSSPTPAEATARRRLESAAGFAVSLLDDDGTFASDLNAFDLGLVSASATSSGLGNRLRSTTTPLLTWNPTSYAGLELTEGVAGLDFGTSNTTSVNVTANVLPFSGQLFGTTAMLDSARDLGWGEPAGALVAARVSDHPALFSFLPGQPLADNSPAANCRTAFPGDATSFNRHTGVGWLLFDSAVAWSARSCQRWLFGNGFETGTTGGWSTTQG